MKRYSGGLVQVGGTGKFLFEVRAPGDSSPGQWGLIGGGAEGDEDSLQTMMREWREEIGGDPAQVNFTHRKDLTVLGSKGDTLAYAVFDVTVPPDAPLASSEAAGLVALDRDQILAELERDRFTKVAQQVLGHVLGEQ